MEDKTQDTKKELLRARMETLQTIIDKANKLDRLSKNDDFVFFINMLHSKQKQYDDILHKPKTIGYITKKATGTIGNIQYVDSKYTVEEDNAKIKEAQYRYDTFQRVIDMIKNFNEESKRAAIELSKLTKPKV